jgi:hypothetical protein
MKRLAATVTVLLAIGGVILFFALRHHSKQSPGKPAPSALPVLPHPNPHVLASQQNPNMSEAPDAGGPVDVEPAVRFKEARSHIVALARTCYLARGPSAPRPVEVADETLEIFKIKYQLVTKDGTARVFGPAEAARTDADEAPELKDKKLLACILDKISTASWPVSYIDDESSLVETIAVGELTAADWGMPPPDQRSPPPPPPEPGHEPLPIGAGPPHH